MRAIFKDGLLVLVPEGDAEAGEAEQWKAVHAGHAFCLRESDGTSLELEDLGARAEACREPINVISDSPDPAVRPTGNFATAPFELDGQRYVSVESFWQGLKFPADRDRRRIAKLEGPLARAEGDKQGYGATVSYGGKEIAVGTRGHWQLMVAACRAKFEQDEDARAALLATGERPLTHIVHRDSRAIPGIIMADIWTRIRADLRERHTP